MNWKIIFPVLLSFIAKAQPLTNQQVYNFNVGDVIYKQYSCTNAMFAFDSVTAKVYSPNNDSITYFFNRIQHTANTGQQTVTTSYTSYSMVVTNLNSNILPPAQINQDTVKNDTSYISYCGKKVYGYKYKCQTPCPSLSINEVTELYFYIEDLGGPYKYSYFTGSSPGSSACSYIADVLYYKKNGVSCGTRPTVGFKEYSIEHEDISVSPVPASEEIEIKINGIDKQGLNWELFSISGQETMSGVLTGTSKLSVKNLEKGIYFLKVSGPGYYSSKKIVVE